VAKRTGTDPFTHQGPPVSQTGEGMESPPMPLETLRTTETTETPATSSGTPARANLRGGSADVKVLYETTRKLDELSPEQAAWVCECLYKRYRLDGE